MKQYPMIECGAWDRVREVCMIDACARSCEGFVEGLLCPLPFGDEDHATRR